MGERERDEKRPSASSRRLTKGGGGLRGENAKGKKEKELGIAPKGNDTRRGLRRRDRE